MIAAARWVLMAGLALIYCADRASAHPMSGGLPGFAMAAPAGLAGNDSRPSPFGSPPTAVPTSSVDSKSLPSTAPQQRDNKVYVSAPVPNVIRPALFTLVIVFLFRRLGYRRV